MKTHKRIILFVSLIVFLILMGVYYFKPRVIKPTLICALPIPNKSFSRYEYKSFDIVNSTQDLYFHLLSDWPFQTPNIDSITIQNLDNKLNYEQYNYIIMWNRKVIELQHSPHLTNHMNFGGNKETILFPICEHEDTDSIYIYSISKNHNFIAQIQGL